ncbi:TPA: glycosyltransferase family 39 protein [Photobacterium damselae]
MEKIMRIFNRLTKQTSLAHIAIITVISTFIIRFVTLSMYPLMDTTEARYGEMARIMAETGNWITPMFDYNVPFWGKPPLFSWLSAASIKLLGNSEFAVRLPHLLVGILITIITYLFAKKVQKNNTEALLSAAILATSTAFIVISGAVMTDTALTFAITLSMVSFWRNWQQPSLFFGLLFFVGLAIGMLAKGPLTLVLVGMSIILWSLSDGRWRLLYAKLPWGYGLVTFLVLTLPWYLLAEWKTPGFLHYFIIGEHFMRFVVSGWKGDLYGTAHEELRGTIWLFALLATLPWSPLFIWQLIKRLKAGGDSKSSSDGYLSFLWCWMLAPLFLFTFAGNILTSYVMPSIPAFALLLSRYQSEQPLNKKVYTIGFITPILLFITAIVLGSGVTGKTADNRLLTIWKQQPEHNQSALVYLGKRPFSAQYYSDGKAVRSEAKPDQLLADLNKSTFIVLSNTQDNLRDIQQYPNCQQRGKTSERILYYCSIN